MFNNTKYTKYYFSIIKNAQNRVSEVQGEIHHIIPRCIGGTDDPKNLVKLTYREHYICHALLVKMNDSKHLINAFWQMSFKNQVKYFNSRLFEISRKCYVESIKGSNHWAKTPEFRAIVSASWTDDRKTSFREQVSGDSHWTKNVDMNDHAAHMRKGLTKEKLREIGLKSRMVTDNPMKDPTIAAMFKKPKEKVTCPHCGKVGGKPVMMRYHFEKCKFK